MTIILHANSNVFYVCKLSTKFFFYLKFPTVEYIAGHYCDCLICLNSLLGTTMF